MFKKLFLFATQLFAIYTIINGEGFRKVGDQIQVWTGINWQSSYLKIYF